VCTLLRPAERSDPGLSSCTTEQAAKRHDEKINVRMYVRSLPDRRNRPLVPFDEIPLLFLWDTSRWTNSHILASTDTQQNLSHYGQVVEPRMIRRTLIFLNDMHFRYRTYVIYIFWNKAKNSECGFFEPELHVEYISYYMEFFFQTLKHGFRFFLKRYIELEVQRELSKKIPFYRLRRKEWTKTCQNWYTTTLHDEPEATHHSSRRVFRPSYKRHHSTMHKLLSRRLLLQTSTTHVVHKTMPQRSRWPCIQAI
jgi:hypothetical protein